MRWRWDEEEEEEEEEVSREVAIETAPLGRGGAGQPPPWPCRSCGAAGRRGDGEEGGITAEAAGAWEPAAEAAGPAALRSSCPSAGAGKGGVGWAAAMPLPSPSGEAAGRRG